MGIKVNMRDVQDNITLPPGDYVMQLSAYKVAEASKSTGKPFVTFDMIVMDDDNTEYNGRHAWRNYSLQPQALWALKQAMIAFDCDPDIFDDDDLDIEDALNDLIGYKALVTITNEEYNGKVQARVQKTVNLNA